MQLDWANIDTVLVDMDGTLLDLRFDNYFWRELVPTEYARARNLAFKDAQRIVETHYERVYGTLEWYCVDYWTRKLNMDIRGLKARVSDRVSYLPKSEQFLAALRHHGKRTVLVTNAHQDALAIKLGRTNLAAQVDRVISSHETNYPKEHGEFWSSLQEREPFHPQRTLLIEDSLTVLESARQYGLAHLVAIRCPDTGAPARVIEHYPAVDSVADLVF